MKERKQIWYSVSSIFFALILFVYATTNSFQKNINTRQITSETYTNTIQSVPIDIKYDSDDYFISGFSSEVSVQLTGSNRVTLASEMQENTRSFRVVADLSKLQPGTHEVGLTIENLPTGLTATINPTKITVKIGKKASKTVEVKALIPNSQIDEDVTVDEATISTGKATVTSDEETLERVDHVIASLPSNIKITGNYSISVPLQAVDENGTVLPSVITPAEVNLKITVKSKHSSSSGSSSSSSTSSSTSTSSSESRN